MTHLTASLVLASATLASQASGQVAPPPRIEISAEVCDGHGNRLNTPRKIYLKNGNSGTRVSATVRYDTSPASGSYQLYDQALGSFTEQYPKDYEHRLAPGERKMIGCTEIARSGAAIRSYNVIPIKATVTGAVVVDPSSPRPPSEEPKGFIAFFVENWGPHNGSCPSGGKVPGPYWATNLHPQKRIAVDIEMLDHRGRKVGNLRPVLAPMSNNRLTCSNADAFTYTLGRVTSAAFTTDPVVGVAPELINTR